nr:immunoglobulin heavy chain junction region [Mus musculus]
CARSYDGYYKDAMDYW